jgi:hypothetical protein
MSEEQWKDACSPPGAFWDNFAIFPKCSYKAGGKCGKRRERGAANDEILEGCDR